MSNDTSPARCLKCRAHFAELEDAPIVICPSCGEKRPRPTQTTPDERERIFPPWQKTTLRRMEGR